jgi:hypothetical protein
MLALLRPRRERPRRCNAADNRNELAPLQSIELHPLAQPTPGQHIALVRISQGSLRCGIFNPAYVGSGHSRRFWLLGSTVRMSASHPKATVSLRSSELTLRARRGLTNFHGRPRVASGVCFKAARRRLTTMR